MMTTRTTSIQNNILSRKNWFQPHIQILTSAPQIRLYSHLTHVGSDGKVSMVDVSEKEESTRTAVARGVVFVGRDVTHLIKENLMKKGDVLTTSQIAGIVGAKLTPQLVPLCHSISLSHVNVTCTLDEDNHSVNIICSTKSTGKTGVEMEALTGVSIAALTVYDMCKAVTKDMVISEISLVSKTGGSRGDYHQSNYFLHK